VLLTITQKQVSFTILLVEPESLEKNAEDKGCMSEASDLVSLMEVFTLYFSPKLS